MFQYNNLLSGLEIQRRFRSARSASSLAIKSRTCTCAMRGGTSVAFPTATHLAARLKRCTR
eukprot:8739502-Pyramimonas_sp.AAC.1